MYRLSPSILSADFAQLGEDIKVTDRGGADYIHIDVMDGMFVPSISYGMPIVKASRKVTDKVLDVHLMIVDPDRYIEEFIQCGADIVTVHAEACTHLDRTLSLIREKGAKAGVALNPATPIETIIHVLEKVDMVLIMTVNPGFGGQRFIPYTKEKVARLRELINEKGLNIDIEVDGGINHNNAAEVMAAGANVLVAGSAVFGGDILENTRAFKKIFEEYGE